MKRVHIAKYERELKRRRYEMEIDKHECRNSRDLYEISKRKRKICAEDNQRVNIEEICA